MSWSIERVPNFVVDDSLAMVALLVAYQAEIIRQGVANQAAYADAYARVFGDLAPEAWIRQPPATVARGITSLIRQVGLFVMLDDAVALSALVNQTSWRAALPPVHSARTGPSGPVYTPTRTRQLLNRQAFEALVHRAAALAFAERLPSVALDALPRSLAVRDATTAMFDAVIDEASALNDGTSRTLRQIQATAWQLIDSRRAPRDEGVIVLGGELPSLVCAHLAYREARQAPRIRRANPTAHPNFMPPRLAIPPWP